MNFDQYYKEILKSFITEAEGDEEEVGVEDGNVEGVEGVDVLPQDQESALSGSDTGSESGLSPNAEKKLIDLTNLLLNSLRFKPSDEFRAYLKMPKFHNLKPIEKLATIRNVLSDHPERIIKENDEGDMSVDPNDGNLASDIAEGGELSENDEMDLLRLIIRAINVNPYALSITLKELPYKADKDNYTDIIETIEGVLF